MSDIKYEQIPDGSGTVRISGLESLTDDFVLKNEYLKREGKELERLKGLLRGAALPIIRAAQAAGAQRAFISSSGAGGVSVTLPDYTKPGNRSVFGDDKLSELMKRGGLERLGLKPEEVFEEERTGGEEQIVLKGRWVVWFREHFGALLETDEEIKWERTEPKVIRRLRFDVIGKLEAAAAAGSAVAQFLVEKGLSSLMVKAEKR
jgi:hypothetical protein